LSKSESGIGEAKSTVTRGAPLAHAIKKVGLFSFVFVMYSYNTAGPFGLEDQVRTSGPGMSLLYQLIIPFFWCIPISLVAAELTTAMPVEGGFYRWTRAAFGDFWDFSPAGGIGRRHFCWVRFTQCCSPIISRFTFLSLRDGGITEWRCWSSR